MSDIDVEKAAARQHQRQKFAARQRQILQKLEPLKSLRAEAPPVKIEGSTATIRLYQGFDDWGEFWGMSANEFAAELDKLPATVETIDLRINSGGGMVFEAVTILNTLRSHPAKVVATVEGLAASAASFIAAAADETVMMPGSRLMIHAVRGVAIGTASDLREVADLFDSLTEIAAEIYAQKSGEPESFWLDMMLSDGDQWFSPAEAVAAGLADRIAPAPEDEDDGSAAAGADDESDNVGDASQRFDPALSLELLDI